MSLNFIKAINSWKRPAGFVGELPQRPARFAPQKSVLPTLAAVFLWLFLQNFNLLPQKGGFHAHFEANSACSACEFSGQICSEACLHLPEGWSPPARPAGYAIKKVVIDAGHGGKDPGCVGVGGTYEKNNTLAIALALGAKIEAEFEDVKVIYTRKTDVFVELKERAAIANRNNADLFISIHCNSMSVATAHGVETYVMGLHTAAHNLEVAKRENASIYLEDNYKRDYEGYDPNSAEAHILGSMWQSAYLEQSILIAGLVQRQSADIAGRVDRGVKQAGFLVLRETAMPAILVETGYLTNANEETFLAGDEGRDQMAQSIFEAFKAYKTQMEGGKPTPVGPPKPKPAKPQTAAKPADTPPKTTAPATQPATTAKPTATPQPVKNTPPTTTKNNTAQPKTAASSPAKTPAAATQWPKKSNENAATTPPKTPNAAGYRIQVIAWPNRLDPNSGQLALLTHVTEEKKGNEYQYFVGNFASQKEAERMLAELKNMGFKTAKIVEKN